MGELQDAKVSRVASYRSRRVSSRLMDRVSDLFALRFPRRFHYEGFNNYIMKFTKTNGEKP